MAEGRGDAEVLGRTAPGECGEPLSAAPSAKADVKRRVCYDRKTRRFLEVNKKGVALVHKFQDRKKHLTLPDAVERANVRLHRKKKWQNKLAKLYTNKA